MSLNFNYEKLFKHLFGFLFDDYMESNVRISEKGRELLRDRKTSSAVAKAISRGELNDGEIIIGK